MLAEAVDAFQRAFAISVEGDVESTLFDNPDVYLVAFLEVKCLYDLGG